MTVAVDAIDDLVEADRRLASVQLELAIEAGGDSRDIRSAQRSLAKAGTYAATGRPAKAVMEYKQAWKHAVKALR